MSTSFTLDSTAPVITPAKAVEQVEQSEQIPSWQWLEEAADVLGEYVSPATSQALNERMGLGAAPTAAVTKSVDPALAKAAAWAASASDSGIIDPSKYRGAGGQPAKEEARGTKRPATSGPVSVAAKRLAKTDTRGMKSMMSFFAKKPRK